ncbi:hypothetical protein M153_12700020704, partial [Pseudoloma neurophilia]
PPFIKDMCSNDMLLAIIVEMAKCSLGQCLIIFDKIKDCLRIIMINVNGAQCISFLMKCFNEQICLFDGKIIGRENVIHASKFIMTQIEKNRPLQLLKTTHTACIIEEALQSPLCTHSIKKNLLDNIEVVKQIPDRVNILKLIQQTGESRECEDRAAALLS